MSQHLSIGSTLKCTSGFAYRVDNHLDSGGQGSVYSATGMDTGANVVIKTYHKGFDLHLAKRRIESLIQADLPRDCTGFAAPKAIIETPTLAHVAIKVGEASLDAHLQEGTISSLQDRIVVAAALSRLVELLEARGIFHGDLNPENVRIDLNSEGIQGVYLIDFDNASGKNFPESCAYGSPLSMSPEARLALKHKTLFTPSLESDRYSLAVLLHELITLRNPCQKEMNQDTPVDFFAAMEQSRWTSDPTNDALLHQSLGGIPAGSVTGPLYRYLKDGLTAVPEMRTTPKTWREILNRALNQVIVCPNCGAEMVVNKCRGDCHWCLRDFPIMKLKMGKTIIPLSKNGILVGRSDLGGSKKVSIRHAIFRRIGPETFVEPTGSNSTFRILPNGRNANLTNGKQYPLSHGDRLRFGDVDVSIT